MKRLTDNKIILIKRKTRLENLIARYNTQEQAQFYVEHMGGDFSDYQAEHQTYQAAVASVTETLESFGRVQTVDREYVPNFIFGSEDIVVVIGQDGLVANTLKYLSSQLLIGVNPDPKRWDGILLPFCAADLPLILPEVLAHKRQIKQVTLAKAQLNDGQFLYGVNDLFIGQKTHVSARYKLSLEGKSEQQSSSGIIISTGLGSTGWLKSILTGAAAIAGNTSSGNTDASAKGFNWNADLLYYTVREPYPSRSTAASLVFGQIKKGIKMTVHSLMPENGVIFSDGVESDFLEFNSGMEATISIAEKKGQLVV